MVNNRRGGLGRGLGALIPTAPSTGATSERPEREPEPAAAVSTTTPPTGPRGEGAATGTSQAGSGERGDDLLPIEGASYCELAVEAVVPNARQPRADFDEDALDELVTSIREVGLLQPVVVRPIGRAGARQGAGLPERGPGDDGNEPRYELVMGERRWRAAQRAGMATIPAIVRETPDDAMLRDALLENLHRQQLNPLEEAAAYAQLLEDFAVTHEDLAGRIGRSRSQVSNTLRLLNLPPAVQRRVAAGVLSAGHARALLGLDDPEAQDRLAHRIVAEGLSVRAVEELVALGDVGRPPRAGRSRPAQAPGLSELAGRLSDRLETRVRVQMGRTRGKVVIDFASLDDLRRIIGVVAPEEADRMSPEPDAPEQTPGSQPA